MALEDILQKTQETEQEQPKEAKESSGVGEAKELVLDGEDIPEAFRGKKAKEIVDQILMTSTELERLKAQLSEKERMLEETKRGTRQPTEEELKREREREFFSDPIGFLEKHHLERTAPIVNQYFEDQAKLQRELAKQRIGEKEFKRFEKRINELIMGVPVSERARPEAWDIAYTIALGEEARKKASEMSAREGYHVETEGSPRREEKKVSLSEEEKRVASKFGMSEEDYIKWKESI